MVLPAWLIAVIRQLSQLSLLRMVSPHLSNSREDGGSNSPLTLFFVAATGIAERDGEGKDGEDGGKEGRKEDREGQTGSEGERERTGGENIRLEQARFRRV